MSSQLPLGLRLADRCDFDSFFPGRNAALIRQLRALVDEGGPALVYLGGDPGTGKSHLLQAALRRLTDHGGTGAYLPLAMAGEELSPATLQGLETLDLICLDDLDRIAWETRWSAAVADLLGRAGACPTRLLLSGRQAATGLPAPEGLGFRLHLATVLELQPLADDEKIWALQARARALGLKLPESVGRWLLRHHPGDLGALSRLLESLDYASLAAQRRLTVPFIRSLLGPGAPLR